MSSTSIESAEKDLSLSATKPRALIWDLGGVLTGVSWKRYSYCIGLRAFLLYIAADWRLPFTIKNRAFEVLRSVRVPDHIICPVGPGLPGGESMPPLMVAYQSGLLNRDEILPLAHDTLARVAQEGYFSSRFEQALITRMIDEIFNPETLVFSHYVVPEGVELICTLASQTFSDGTPRYKLYVLSNWDPVSFDSIYKTCSSLFTYFDGIVVSGVVGLMKPSFAIFDHIIHTYELDKATSVFVDDQPENIAAAQGYGIGTPILFKNFTQLKRDLLKEGIDTGTR